MSTRSGTSCRCSDHTLVLANAADVSVALVANSAMRSCSRNASATYQDTRSSKASISDSFEKLVRWRRPRKIFVNSALLSLSAGTCFRSSQSATSGYENCSELRWMADLDHLAFGVSVEDRRYGLPRIRSLQDTPARIRFLSVEPLLADLGPLDLTGIDWVIVGGESGPRARPMLREWVVKIRRQCRAQRVPFFFKQWGGARKHETGRTLDGRTYDDFPSPSIAFLQPTLSSRPTGNRYSCSRG